jgi:hypothetical protein
MIPAYHVGRRLDVVKYAWVYLKVSMLPRTFIYARATGWTAHNDAFISHQTGRRLPQCRGSTLRMSTIEKAAELEKLQRQKTPIDLRA